MAEAETAASVAMEDLAPAPASLSEHAMGTPTACKASVGDGDAEMAGVANDANLGARNEITGIDSSDYAAMGDASGGSSGACKTNFASSGPGVQDETDKGAAQGACSVTHGAYPHECDCVFIPSA